MSNYRKKITINNLSANQLLMLLGLFFACAGLLIGHELLADNSGEAVKKAELIELYDEITRDNSSRETVEKWLKNNWMMYRIDDSELTGVIEDLCPFAFKSGFSTYEKVLENCIYTSLVRQLEEDLIITPSSFLDFSHDLRVSVPPEKYQPADNIAYTCFDGKLADRVIRLNRNNPQEYLELHVVGGYTCSEGDVYPDLQLNERQAWKLFKRKLLRTDYATALIL